MHHKTNCQCTTTSAPAFTRAKRGREHTNERKIRHPAPYGSLVHHYENNIEICGYSMRWVSSEAKSIDPSTTSQLETRHTSNGFTRYAIASKTTCVLFLLFFCITGKMCMEFFVLVLSVFGVWQQFASSSIRLQSTCMYLSHSLLRDVGIFQNNRHKNNNTQPMFSRCALFRLLLLSVYLSITTI